MGIPVKIENVVIAWPNLTELHAPPGTDAPAKYGAKFLLDPTKNDAAMQTMRDLEAAFLQVAADASKTQFVDQMPRPYKDGDKVNQDRGAKGKNPRPELVGKWELRASRAAKMGPVPTADQNAQPMDGAKIFGGCIVHAYVDLYYSPNPTNPGIYCGLNGVQLVTDVGVDRVGGGGPSLDQMFQPIPGAPAPVQPVEAPAAPADDTPPWAR